MAVMDHSNNVRVRVYDLMTFITRLTQLLSEEIALLGGEDETKIVDLQREKMRLASTLEAQRRVIELNPESATQLTDADQANLRAIMSALQCILKENHRRLLERSGTLRPASLERMGALAKQHSEGAYHE